LLAADTKHLLKHITVHAKFHLKDSESIEQDIIVPVSKAVTLKDLVDPLASLTGSNYFAFANGKKHELKASALGILKNESRLLLYPVGGAAAKPEGPRRFVRFPKHHFAEEYYVGSNDQSICYMPTEDVLIIGWGFYRHHYDYINQMQIRTTYRIYDTSNTTQLTEVTHPSYYLQYADIECD
jgi:hypothetical protein